MPAYDAMLEVRRSATCSSATSRARRTWPTATRARPAGSASRGDVGPRRDEPRDRHRHRDARLGPDGLRHRAGRVASTSAATRSRRRTSPASRCPITKHNYLVTRVEDIAPTLRAGVLRRAVRPPGPGARRHHEGRAAGVDATSSWDGSPVRLPGYRPEHRAAPRRHQARRRADRRAPSGRSSSAGTASSPQGRASSCASSSRRPASRWPRRCSASAASRRPIRSRLGMMGMHGEAWVNHGHPGVGPHHRARACASTIASPASSRRTRTRAKKIHCELDPAEINKNVRVDVPLVGDVAETLRALMPGRRQAATARAWVGAHPRAEGRLGGPRHPDAAAHAGSSSRRT